MSTELDFQDLTQKGVLANYLDEQKDRNDCPIRLSKAGSCKRQIALLAAGVPRKPLDFENAATFSFGTMRGEQLAAGLKRAVEDKEDESLLVRTEYTHWLEIPNPDSEDGHWSGVAASILMERMKDRFGPDLPMMFEVDEDDATRWIISVRGRSDVSVLEGNTLTVGEIKTAKEWPWKKVMAEGIDGVNGSYKVQLACYSVALEELLPEFEVKDPFFIFENKNGQTTRNGPSSLVTVHMSMDLARQLVTNQVRPMYAQLFKAIISGTERDVAPDFGPNNAGKLPWQCAYCEVAEACWEHAGLRNNKPKQRIPEWYCTIATPPRDERIPTEDLKKDAPY